MAERLPLLPCMLIDWFLSSFGSVAVVFIVINRISPRNLIRGLMNISIINYSVIKFFVFKNHCKIFYVHCLVE